ncbi:glycoside hydrolase family 17 protein [Glonium stellatum]|uniref:Probable glucan endo-1,3-beta-glucosidase eglC n=1 Tax=Glonium stellatum TaxID=574774 RepID=A0A8E2EXF3_9PEZI|nr:glycoside hydrolase family 17 protein [Glonium stellatum]
MRFSSLYSLAAAFHGAAAQIRGFNYASTLSNSAPAQQSDFNAEFTAAKNLPGTSGFTSARLYTMIQGGTTDTPISAIPAAIATNTTLLLGLWASGGTFANELAALKTALSQYGTDFTNLIAGISVGSEDLYRISPTGIENNSGVGAEPSDIVNYINQVRSAIQGTGAKGKPVGHVDTWTAWVNTSNSAVVDACDFLGMDAYPYWQTTTDNSISSANATFFSAYDATVGQAKGKPVWVTETGWPVSGPTENQAVASTQNAQTYWSQVACSLLGKVNTYWYILQETASPNFSVVSAGDVSSAAPLYDLTCAASSSGASAQ